jgi:hypothetical protein
MIAVQVSQHMGMDVKAAVSVAIRTKAGRNSQFTITFSGRKPAVEG